MRAPAARLAPVRGVLLAALATLLTGVGHVAGGGALPALTPLAVLVPLLATVLVAVAERCRGLLAVAVALGGGQAALHVLLTVLGGPHGPGGGAVPGVAMLAGHAVATLVLAPVVCAADGAVTGLLVALCRVPARRRTPPAVAVPVPVRPVPADDVAPLAAADRWADRARRGPPLPC